MKLNNKGFAVSVLLYSIIAVIIFVLTLILSVYSTNFHNRSSLVDTIRSNIIEKEMIDLDSLGISVTINPEIPEVITKGDNYLLVLSNGYSLGGRDGVLSCKIDGVQVSNPLTANTSTLNSGTHEIECMVNATDTEPAIDSKTIEVTYQAYTINNIINDGSFELDLTAWTLEDAEISNDGYDSIKALKLLKNKASTSAKQITSVTPVVGHKYYGSMAFKLASSASFSADDDRFDWFNNEDFDGRMIFARKNIKSTTWTKISHIQSISNNTYIDSDYVLDNPWYIRNYFKNSTVDAYVDQLVLVDLTFTFGEGNEPTKEWCDSHINYFDGSTTIYK